MKNLFLFSFIALSICSTKEAHALDISNVNYSGGVRIEMENDKVMYIHKCSAVTEDLDFEHARYEVIGSIQHCAVNMVLWRANRFFFFKRGNKTYFRQIKILEARTFEVVKVEEKTIHLGPQVELSTVDPDKSYSLL